MLAPDTLLHLLASLPLSSFLLASLSGLDSSRRGLGRLECSPTQEKQENNRLRKFEPTGQNNSHSLSLTHTLSLTSALSLSLSHTHTLSLSLSLTHTLFLSQVHSLSLSLSHTLSLSLTIYLSISIFVSHFR